MDAAAKPARPEIGADEPRLSGGRWFERTRRYSSKRADYDPRPFIEDDHDYGTTWARGPGAGYIINRKPSADAGWDPEPA